MNLGKERPLRPYKNLAEFVERIRISMTGDHEFPCMTCNGSGRVPREGSGSGFHMPVKEACKVCDGTGAGTRDEWMRSYKNVIAKYDAAFEEWTRLANIWKKKFQKHLTALKKDERAALDLFGIEGPKNRKHKD